MSHNVYVYILVMAGVTYLIRMLPMALVKKEITSPYIKSFLYYVPYACLAAMTFPAILSATNSTVSAAIGFAVALIAAYGSASGVRRCVYCGEDSSAFYVKWFHDFGESDTNRSGEMLCNFLKKYTTFLFILVNLFLL